MNRQKTISILKNQRPVIAPSMLKCDFADLGRDVDRLCEDGARLLHWDVMDGNFVPNLSYGAMVIESVRARTDVLFEAHLMISDPEKYVDEYLRAGCECITFHIEAVPEPTSLLEKLRNSGCVAGLSLNPGTPVAKLQPYLTNCDLVLVMSVEPGFGGQKFMPDVLSKCQELRNLAGDDILLSIDGGIGTETIGRAAAESVDLYVAGSAIFEEADYGSALRTLKDTAQRHLNSSHKH